MSGRGSYLVACSRENPESDQFPEPSSTAASSAVSAGHRSIMTALEREQSPQTGQERPEAGPSEPDAASSVRGSVHATAAAVGHVLGHGDPNVQKAGAIV